MQGSWWDTIRIPNKKIKNWNLFKKFCWFSFFFVYIVLSIFSLCIFLIPIVIKCSFIFASLSKKLLGKKWNSSTCLENTKVYFLTFNFSFLRYRADPTNLVILVWNKIKGEKYKHMETKQHTNGSMKKQMKNSENISGQRKMGTQLPKSMECCKSSSKREVKSNTWLLSEKRKTSNKKPNLHLKRN